MLHIKISPQRRLIVRAGYSLILLFFIPVCVFIGANLPLPVVIRFCICTLLSALIITAFCGATSEVFFNGRRLVIVTSAGYCAYFVQSIKQIRCFNMPNSCFIFFAITTRNGNTRIYHLVSPTSNMGPYSVTAQVLSKVFMCCRSATVSECK